MIPSARPEPSRNELMELLACPRCGSELLLMVTGAGERIVLLVDASRQAVRKGPELQPMELLPTITNQHLSCGACSWRGSAEALVASRM